MHKFNYRWENEETKESSQERQNNLAIKSRPFSSSSRALSSIPSHTLELFCRHDSPQVKAVACPRTASSAETGRAGTRKLSPQTSLNYSPPTNQNRTWANHIPSGPLPRSLLSTSWPVLLAWCPAVPVAWFCWVDWESGSKFPAGTEGLRVIQPKALKPLRHWELLKDIFSLSSIFWHPVKVKTSTQSSHLPTCPAHICCGSS